MNNDTKAALIFFGFAAAATVTTGLVLIGMIDRDLSSLEEANEYIVDAMHIAEAIIQADTE